MVCKPGSYIIVSPIDNPACQLSAPIKKVYMTLLSFTLHT